MSVKIEFECRDFELTPELEEHLRSLTLHPGWPVIKTIIKQKFAIEYGKLRDSRRNDASYSKICGYLDAVEEILEEIQEIENK